MPLLTLDQILTANDVCTEDVDIPEWGGTVRLRTLTGTELDQIGEKLAKSGDTSQFNHMLIAASLVDADGKQLCGLSKVKDLARKSGRALRRVAKVALALNGFNTEELEGNLESAPAALPGTSTQKPTA